MSKPSGSRLRLCTRSLSHSVTKPIEMESSVASNSSTALKVRCINSPEAVSPFV